MNLTLDLSDFIDTHLARSKDHREEMWHSRKIEPHLAKKILELTNNQSHCYIEFNDEFSNHLATPVLWDWAAWQVECDRRIRAQKRAEVERVQHTLAKANIILISKALEDMAFDKENAIKVATTLLQRGNLNAIKAVGVTEIITDINNIPKWMERMI